MKKYLPLLLFLAACTSSRNVTGDDGKIRVTFVQINDVYEIAPLEAGTKGGMARVATLLQQEIHKNRNTVMVMAGDFLSPSVYNTLREGDKPIRGKQMVEAMNSAGVEMAIFGNHEFDLREADLQERINESKFAWVATNTFYVKDGAAKPFMKNGIPMPKYRILRFTDKDGTETKVGFIGLTIPFTRQPYVTYDSVLSSAITTYNLIKDSCDAVVALTHQLVQDDVRLAQNLPGLDLIIGGHEHDHRFIREKNVLITKAHANAKTAYVINLDINKKKRRVKVETSADLKELDQSVSLDPITDRVVQKWINIANENYKQQGFNATRQVITSGESLEGREGEIRSGSTNLTRLIVDAMLASSPQADLAIMNSGSIRVDDVLVPPINEYDILRTLPFGGSIDEVDMKGSLLRRVLDAGRLNRGNGGFLQSAPVTFDATLNIWNIKGEPIDENKTYRVLLSNFLLTGGETNLGFLKDGAEGILKKYELTEQRRDIRKAVIAYLDSKR